MPIPKNLMGSYAPESNFKEDWDGTIREVTFEKQEGSQNYAAHLVMDADDGDEVEMFCGLGGDWATYDGGSSVEHPKGATKRFHQSTHWSRLLARMVECCYEAEGEDNVMIVRDRERGGRGAQMGESFAGLRFHWDVEKGMERRPVEQKDAEGKTIMGENGRPVVTWTDQEVERMWPQKYLGIAGEAPKATAPSSSPTTTTSESAPQSESGSNSSGSGTHPAIANLPLPDQVKLKTLAKTNDFGNFVDAVMDLTGSDGTAMLERAEVIQALSDEGFYLSLRG